jgi:hypothetical protein
MVEGNKEQEREIFISYLDVDNKTVEGYFIFVSDNGWAIKFKTKNNNILTIPHSRVLRLKEKLGGRDEY